MHYIVTGGAGFIGSHMVDRLIKGGHRVTILDNLLSGNAENIHPDARFLKVDIRNFEEICPHFEGVDGVFHFAAIARTPWCIEDPILAYQTNVMGTLNVLESARRHAVKRVVLSSSNVVYAFMTPYRTSKEAVEDLGSTYTDMYGMSVISLRYSNVYGRRQSELGPSPNVFAALRKSKRENGYLTVTGDGKQTRNYTHVSDIVNGNWLAMQSQYCGVVDLCTGVPVELNTIAKMFNCPIKYIADRPGDIKHIEQDPLPALEKIGWRATVSIEMGKPDILYE